MIKHYLKTALRNLGRNPVFSLINIAGLTLGIATAILIGIFVWDEQQYDRTIPGGSSVYRVYTESERTEGISTFAVTPPMFATVLEHDFPQVDKAVRIMQIQNKGLFENKEKAIYEDNGIMADAGFFSVFPLGLKYGSYQKSLEDFTSIVLSEKLAERYFGAANPVGKQITVNKHQYNIKAVLKNELGHFHLTVDYIVAMPYAYMPMDSWQWQQFYTYVKLKPGAGIAALQQQFEKYIKDKVQPITRPTGTVYLPFFQNLNQIYLYSAGFKFDLGPRGNITYTKGFTITGIFILLIACFNFINLSTARSLKRAKEVGVRKSAGASRKQLLIQFMGETSLLALGSLAISLLVVSLVLPAFNAFTGKAVQLSILYQPATIALLAAVCCIISFLAGFYPAMVLSGFNPVKVLKGNSGYSASGKNLPWLRQGLVVTQFVLSGLLIICAIIVYRQVDYLHHKDLGFNKDQLLFFPMRGKKMTKAYADFKNELRSAPGVSNVALGYGFPGDLVAGDEVILPKEGATKTYPATQLAVDEDYIKTLGLQLVAGRDFLAGSQADKDNAFIINETAVRELGLGTPEKAIGQTLMWHVWVTQHPDSLKKGQVIGVVKDFHYKGLYDKITTAVLQVYPQAYSRAAVKIKTASIQNSIAAIRDIWNRYSPDFPMEYKFLDDNFEQMYRAEDKLKTLLSLFTGIAIFIGCLGLFGLASFTAERRTKEIGVRKVLGASVNSIVILLSKDFIKLVLMAFIIASPVAWFCMQRWLQDFAYRISIPLWIFVVAGVSAIVLAMLTVSFHAIKSAIANPVKSLRTE